jgi:hypothetical protein
VNVHNPPSFQSDVGLYAAGGSNVAVGSFSFDRQRPEVTVATRGPRRPW